MVFVYYGMCLVHVLSNLISIAMSSGAYNTLFLWLILLLKFQFTIKVRMKNTSMHAVMQSPFHQAPHYPDACSLHFRAK